VRGRRGDPVGTSSGRPGRVGHPRAPSRTGRRPGPTRTREAILRAARTEFARGGYDGTSIRGVARRAGVDPALVYHFFGNKEGVFAAAMQLPVNPAELVPRVLPGDPRGLGERVVRSFLEVWEPRSSRSGFLALLGSALTHEEAAAMLRGFVRDAILGPVARSLELPNADLRATLAASQLVGLAFLRYGTRLEPLASTDVDELAAAVGPTIQRYLTGALVR